MDKTKTSEHIDQRRRLRVLTLILDQLVKITVSRY